MFFSNIHCVTPLAETFKFTCEEHVVVIIIYVSVQGSRGSNLG